MTFKHVKFEDSVTMRSLEKVAREKGWVKEEKIVKQAESTLQSFAAGSNLTENIIKLCIGLRQSGMNKYADELEHKFMVYKQAETLYETSKEKGEDLVDAAHPKGGHKLEEVAGDALVETILERHEKMVDVSRKQPTGKLASSKDILNAVKTIFAQEIRDPEAQKKGKEYMISALNKIKEGIKEVSSGLTEETDKNIRDASTAIIANSKFRTQKKETPFVLSEKLNGYSIKLDKLIADLGAINVEQDNVPTKLITECARVVYDIKNFISGAGHYAEAAKLINDAKDDELLRAIKSGRSRIDAGQSLSWAAGKAFSGELGSDTGAEFHASYMASIDVANTIAVHLARPLGRIYAEYSKLNPSVLAGAWKTWFDDSLKALKTDYDSANTAITNAKNKTTPQGQFLIRNIEIKDLFSPRLMSGEREVFAGVENLNDFQARAQQFVREYQQSLAQARGAIEKASAKRR